MKINTHQLLSCAVAAARKAGDHALANLDRRSEADAITHHDVKLKLDVECQAIAEAVVREAFPDHEILGEEDDHAAIAAPSEEEGVLWPTESDETLWVIDPIDGTVNFSHGLPRWCCSIGVLQGGRPVAGVVYAPALGLLYTATCDTVAACNGEPLHVSDTDALEESIVMTGVDRHKNTRVPPLAVFNAIANTAQRPRIMGVAALDMCSVAAGQADGYMETGIFLWDVAAAGLIVQQAGGRTEILQRDNGFKLQFLATNGPIHEELKGVVLKALGTA
ncbi:MAG: inositol monophosphatase family protein [Kiritimatiellia bacterium]|jgi:myo-inositol-1(or 4)-monophosphatase|nr:inositol monophosphatase family protein [Kiritimatiellia bacterium]MDP6630014.1 inositol monophosphatase family protein [Kiritimatiellia bacterium]MDP6810981.1 inositol monophosphatase family protein [Kiritimatiellia bacterium]MDP7025220.1 inositol monophosphatase family protein [Kiritimatiellia bacterium]